MKKLESEYTDTHAWGMVSSVDLYGCDKNFIKDPIKIKEFIVSLCEHIDMKRHGEPLIERFAEGALEGYSAMQFIETSSVTLHFDETVDRAFIDIFSCKYFDPSEALEFSKSFFKATDGKERSYLRY